MLKFSKNDKSSETATLAVKQTDMAITAYIKRMKSDREYMDGVAKQMPGYQNPDGLEKDMRILVKGKESLVLDYVNAIDNEHQVTAKYMPDYKPRLSSSRSDEEKEKLDAALERFPESQRKDIQEAIKLSREKRFDLYDGLQGRNAKDKGFCINPASEISMRIIFAAVIQGKRNFIERVSGKEKAKSRRDRTRTVETGSRRQA